MHCTTAGIEIDKSIHSCENDILFQLRKSIISVAELQIHVKQIIVKLT